MSAAEMLLRVRRRSRIAPRAPLPSSRPEPALRAAPSGGGPSPFLVVGVALVAGIALAKWLDWRGHAHPRG